MMDFFRIIAAVQYNVRKLKSLITIDKFIANGKGGIL